MSEAGEVLRSLLLRALLDAHREVLTLDSAVDAGGNEWPDSVPDQPFSFGVVGDPWWLAPDPLIRGYHDR